MKKRVLEQHPLPDETKKEEPWWQRSIVKDSAVVLIGIGIGIVVCYVWLVQQDWFIGPAIANAVKATMAVQPTPLSCMPTIVPTVSPTATSIPTAPSTPTPTSTPTTTVLFDDDFENGFSKWTADEGWEIRQDKSGNHLACIKLIGKKDSFMNPRVSEIWQDYQLNLDIMIADPLNDGAITIDVHYNEKPKMHAYQLEISEKNIDLSRYNPDSKKWIYLTSSTEQPPLTPLVLYPIQVEIQYP